MGQEETFHHKSTSIIKERMLFSMKKNKRLISLALALVMMFSFMAMSASAASIEVPVVQPRGTCPNCTNGYVESSTTYGPEVIDYWSDGCSTMGARHAHYKQLVTVVATCRNCGYRSNYSYTRYWCPYGG